MKSLAREGDSEVGGTAVTAPAGSGGTAAPVLVSMTTDLTARH